MTYNQAMILKLPYILETRRNHALEHATLHILARTCKGKMAGHSNPTGFFLIGDFSTQAVWSATTEALERLRLGERELAIHAGCGTNLVTSALLGASPAWMALRLARSKRAMILMLPVAVALSILGTLVSRPIGTVLQRSVTTEADPGKMRIVDIVLIRKGMYRVITQ